MGVTGTETRPEPAPTAKMKLAMRRGREGLMAERRKTGLIFMPVSFNS